MCKTTLATCCSEFENDYLDVTTLVDLLVIYIYMHVHVGVD